MTTDNQPAPGAPAAGTLAADPAFATFDAETQGAFKNHGWDQKPAAEAAALALKSFREAEKFVGIPKDQIVRMPKDASDADGIKAFRARIGVPADAKGYDFTGLKRTDGSDIDGDLKDALSAAFHAEGVPKDAAPNLTRAILKHLDSGDQSKLAEHTAKLATEKDALAKSWGSNMEANKFIVRQAVMKLGLSEEVVEAFEKATSYSQVMQSFLKIGQMMGEDKFVNTPQGGTPGIMTREQAEARYQELRADTGWLAKFHAGDRKAIAELDALDLIRAG
jgi:hypothetical protein